MTENQMLPGAVAMPEVVPLYELTSKAGAAFTEEAGWSVPLHYGDPAREYEGTRTSTGLIDQSHRGKVELTGAEAASFLHNLCSNDINGLPLGGGCELFLTTNKA